MEKIDYYIYRVIDDLLWTNEPLEDLLPKLQALLFNIKNEESKKLLEGHLNGFIGQFKAWLDPNNKNPEYKPTKMGDYISFCNDLEFEMKIKMLEEFKTR